MSITNELRLLVLTKDKLVIYDLLKKDQTKMVNFPNNIIPLLFSYDLMNLYFIAFCNGIYELHKITSEKNVD